MSWRWRIVVSLATLLVGSGCSGLPEVALIVGPADPGAEMRPDLIVADPEVIPPGSIVALTYQSSAGR